MKAYWFDGPPSNFGDQLTPLLLEAFAGLTAEWAPIEESEIVVCGSLLDALPSDYAGIVLGIGAMYADHPPLPTTADVRVLRGPMSGKAPVYGDPGLLAGLLGTPQEPFYRLGVIPHHVDTTLARAFPNAHVIDITAPPLEVIAQARQCERLVSSSLHGIVLADSLGKPRCWEPCDAVLGSGFKFQDYQAGLDGGSMIPGAFYVASPDRVRGMQEQLLAEFERLSC